MPAGSWPALLPAVALAAAAAALPPSSHRPEPGHTGGFGEPTCRRCHFDGPERPADAGTTIEGLPESWSPGATYPIAVVLRGEGLAKGGFQLSARFAGGEHVGAQAGRLAPTGPGTDTTTARGVTYVHHVVESTQAAAPGTVRWNLVWHAPADALGAVAFHVAGNASNDDASEFGDRIVTAADTVAPVRASHHVDHGVRD